MTAVNRPQLELSDVHISIGRYKIITGIDLEVNEGETVALVGQNGAGKTTTFRGIMGLANVDSGSVRFEDTELTDVEDHKISSYGIGYQPEDRKLFSGLSVDDNIRIPIWASDRQNDLNEDDILESVFEIFPELENRRHADAAGLSGGESKMVAIGRALALQPQLLILDEPLEGLAPVMVENLKNHIKTIKDRGITVLLAEANAKHVAEIADRMYVINRGEIVDSGPPKELVAKPELQELMQGSE